MDPFSHAALGRTLAGMTAADRTSRAIGVAATLGALSPDLDAIVMPFGWDRYLRVHEIGTHSLLGTVICALATGSVIRAFTRTAAWRSLVASAWLGSASHILLDLLSSARMRFLWPVIESQISLPLVAMADPWLAAVLIGGAGGVLFTSRHRRRAAVVALGVAVAFLAVKSVMAGRAIDAYRAANLGTPPAAARAIEARWAALTEWHVFDRSGALLRVWRSNGATHRSELVMTWEIAPESATVAASRSLSSVASFLRGHDLTFAAAVPRPDGHQWILWSDIRYCWNPDDRDAPRLEPMVSGQRGRIACALWFGGEFDGSGRPRHQLVKVAGFTQTRAVDE